MRRTQRTILAVGAVTWLVVSGCDRGDGSTSLSGSLAGDNVLLITLDTTRADRLGCYGYAPAATPTIDAFAASGTLFENAFAQVPLTLPSHASMMTGRYPKEHGIHSNGSGALGADHPTLATVFKEHGYRTAAFIASFVLDARFGLHRGFDVYNDKVAPVTLDRALYKSQLPADVITDRGLEWLRQNSDRPFFCWLHYFDPHDPYQPPDPFSASFAHPYDGEIAFMDSQIKRVADWVRQAGLSNRTLIVIAGDHGEALGEHGLTGHAIYVYEDVLRVPLILVHPKFNSAARIATVVEIADLFPTVLDLFGYDPPDDLLTRSLAAALSGEELAEGEAYSESEYGFVTHGWAQQRSLTTSQWKYVSSTKPELFDRVADPGELRNLNAAKPAVAQRMRKKLEARYESMLSGEASAVAMDDAATRRLEALGYLGSVATSVDEFLTEGLPDPKDMRSVLVRITQARMLMVAGKFDEALQMWHAILRETPRSVESIANLGTCLLNVGDFELAEEKLTEALDINPAATLALTSLGDLYVTLGRLDDAVDHYRMAIDSGSVNPQIATKLGDVLMRLKQPDEALDHYRMTLKAHPDFPAIQTRMRKLVKRLSAVHLGNGRVAECLHTLRIGATYAPDADGVRLLATLLATLQDDTLRNGAEALQWATRLAQLRGGDPNTLDLATLASAHAEAGDFSKAIEFARQAAKAAQATGNADLVATIRAQLNGYRAGKPYRHPRF